MLQQRIDIYLFIITSSPLTISLADRWQKQGPFSGTYFCHLSATPKWLKTVPKGSPNMARKWYIKQALLIDQFWMTKSRLSDPKWPDHVNKNVDVPPPPNPPLAWQSCRVGDLWKRYQCIGKLVFNAKTRFTKHWSTQGIWEKPIQNTPGVQQRS